MMKSVMFAPIIPKPVWYAVAAVVHSAGQMDIGFSAK